MPTTIRATRLVAEECDAPIHLGVTAAGPPRVSIVKSAIGIGALLADGIGDTIRVSMTGSPVDEIVKVVEEVERRMPADAPPVTVAVMGCVVNGPGEAADADVGLAGGKGFAFLFSKGKQVRRVDEAEMVDALIDEVMKLK